MTATAPPTAGEIWLDYMPLSKVRPAKRNPKGHAEEDIDASLDRFGYTEPVFLDERTGRLVAGHGRLGQLRTRKDRGDDPPPGIRVDPTSGEWLLPVNRGWRSANDREAEAYLLASNRLTELGGWINGDLLAVLREQESLVGTGFAEPDVAALLAAQAGAERVAPRPTLADRFLVPPFSILDARSGPWRERKERWLALGIRSEIGRSGTGSATAFNADGCDDPVSQQINGHNPSRRPTGRTFRQDLVNGEGTAVPEKGLTRRGNEARSVDGRVAGALMRSDSGRDPRFYAQKRAVEARLGREITTEEFQARFYVNADHSGGLSEAGTSVFDPVVCELAYRWFSPPGGTVVDPFAGGSVRGIVAALTGRSYLGIDLRPEQIEANQAQVAVIVGDPSPATRLSSDPTALSPIETHGGHLVKRDDRFGVGSSAGGKVRSCLALAGAPGVKGLVTAGSRHSPQVNIVATVARSLGLPCRVHVPAGDPTPELAAAELAGAELVPHRPGYNTVIVARARDDATERGWLNVPFGMECAEAVEQTAGQVGNLPTDLTRIVVPVGSGMSLAGILTGLARAGRSTPVLGVRVGADPSDRLDRYAPPDWRDRVTLVDAGLPYEKHAPTTRLGQLALDPVYEAKCLPFLETGDLLWVVGIRETAIPTGPGNVDYRVGDARDVLPELPPESADLIFTCPPYFDLEVYSEDPRDLSAMTPADFDTAYRQILAGAARALRPDRFAVIVVGNVRDRDGLVRDLRALTTSAMESSGLRLYNDAVLVTMAGSLPVRAGRSFAATRVLGRTHQEVLVFVKGDRRAAARACGDVEADVLAAIARATSEDEALPDVSTSG